MLRPFGHFQKKYFTNDCNYSIGIYCKLNDYKISFYSLFMIEQQHKSYKQMDNLTNRYLHWCPKTNLCFEVSENVTCCMYGMKHGIMLLKTVSVLTPEFVMIEKPTISSRYESHRQKQRSSQKVSLLATINYQINFGRVQKFSLSFSIIYYLRAVVT